MVGGISGPSRAFCLPVTQEGDNSGKGQDRPNRAGGLGHLPSHCELHLELVRHQDAQHGPVYALLDAVHREEKQKDAGGSRKARPGQTSPSTPRSHAIMGASSQGAGEPSQAVKVLERPLLGAEGAFPACRLALSPLEVHTQIGHSRSHTHTDWSLQVPLPLSLSRALDGSPEVEGETRAQG